MEFHQKLVDDQNFLYRVMQEVLEVSDADWKEMPDELKEILAMPMKWHGEVVVERIKHPVRTAIKNFISDAREVLQPVAIGLGYVSIIAMIVWWISYLLSL